MWIHITLIWWVKLQFLCQIAIVILIQVKEADLTKPVLAVPTIQAKLRLWKKSQEYTEELFFQSYSWLWYSVWPGQFIAFSFFFRQNGNNRIIKMKILFVLIAFDFWLCQISILCKTLSLEEHQEYIFL